MWLFLSLSLFFFVCVCSVYNDLLMVFVFVIKIQFKLNYFLLRELLQAGSVWLIHELETKCERFCIFQCKILQSMHCNDIMLGLGRELNIANLSSPFRFWCSHKPVGGKNLPCYTSVIIDTELTSHQTTLTAEVRPPVNVPLRLAFIQYERLPF